MRPTITFVSGSRGKAKEVAEFFPDIEILDADLPEIQDLSPEGVLRSKIRSATALCDGPLLVEDTSLVFDGMGELPGPFIKWFLRELSLDGLVRLASAMGSGRAVARTTVGYLVSADAEVIFDRGETQGMITTARGEGGFGWDPIFQPDGADRTFAEMSSEEKAVFSMRRRALKALSRRLFGLTR